MTAFHSTPANGGELPTIVGLTMSSLEIAGVTGKRHAHVLRDIRNILKDLRFQPTQFWVGYKDAKGETREAFNLPKRETLILVSGYSTEMRARIIDRWMQLESTVGQPVEVEELSAETRRVIGGIMKKVIHSELATILPSMVEAAVIADARAVATEYQPALAILVERKVPPRKRRGFSQKVSARLRRYSSAHGHPTRISRETNRFLFHVDAVSGWLRAEGERLIAEHVAALAGQGVLKLVRPIG